MTEVFLGLGSNIQREANLPSGLSALAATFGELRCSPVYESAAVGFAGPPFFNMVVALYTDMTLSDVLGVVRSIEKAHGRLPTDTKFASRTLDIDILTFGDLIGEAEGLRLPRDEILEYAFVLQPLADLVPEMRHPLLGTCYRLLLQQADFSNQWLRPVTL